MKIGILGGTFNPIHKGHVMLTEYCKNEIGLDKIVLIPTFIPPHKESKDLVDAQHRLNMCRIACDNLDSYTASDIEIRRGGRSYTFQTLELLKEEFPDDELYLIMGADMFLSLEKWKNPEIIFKNAVMTAVPRDDCNVLQLNEYFENVIKPMGAEAIILTQPVLSVSSTFIRKNIQSFNTIETMIDVNVYKYIEKNKLYRT